MSKTNKNARKNDDQDGPGGGFIDGITRLLETVERLADKGQEIRETVNSSEAAKDARVHYGFSVRTAGNGKGGSDIKVEPFGNLRRDKGTGETVVDTVREPIVDVFDEDDRLVVVAEMPGIDVEHLDLVVEGTTLTISAEAGEKRYRTEVELPRSVDPEARSVACNNGIVEISWKGTAE